MDESGFADAPNCLSRTYKPTTRPIRHSPLLIVLMINPIARVVDSESQLPADLRSTSSIPRHATYLLMQPFPLQLSLWVGRSYISWPWKFSSLRTTLNYFVHLYLSGTVRGVVMVIAALAPVLLQPFVFFRTACWAFATSFYLNNTLNRKTGLF